MANTNAASTADREIATTRLLNAPRELVFKVWTDPEQVVKWWGPNGFTNTIYEMDVRPGGVWRFMMHGPDGKDYPNRVTYLEVVPPEKLVFLHGADSEEDPNRFHVTVLFKEKRGQTEISMRMLFDTPEERNRVVEQYHALEGQQQTMTKLAEYLELIQ